MKNRFLIFFIFATVSTVAYADPSSPTKMDAASVLSILQASMGPAVDKLTAKAISWLAIFASLQFLMTNYSVLKSDGDIQAVIAKAAGSFAWLAVCIYLITNGPEFIKNVGNEMFSMLGVTLPTPGSIIASTIAVVSGIAVLAVAVGGVGVVGSTTGGMLLVYVLLFILAIGMFFAFKIFMVQLELGLVVMLSPLSFSFLGLNALKDQGIAPFKALISLAYRILLMTLILSAFTQVSDVVSASFAGMTKVTILTTGIGQSMMTILSALGAYMMLAYVFYKSDSIAASLAGGTTSMGTGDVASAAAAGAAAGAAITSGGASLAGAASKAPQGMGDVIKAMMGTGGGSVSNASGRGMGGQATGEAPRRPASMSMPNANGGTSGAPQRSSAAPGNAAQGAGRSASAANADTAPSRAAANANKIAANQASPTEDTSRGSVEQGGSPVTAGAAATGENTPFGTPATSQGDRATSNVDQAPVRPAAQAETGRSGEPQNSKTGSKNVDTPPVRPAQTDNSRPPVRPIESGANAGIGGASSPMEQKVDRALAALDQQPKRATFREKLSEANHHVAQEKAATVVSINTHHSD